MCVVRPWLPDTSHWLRGAAAEEQQKAKWCFATRKGGWGWGWGGDGEVGDKVCVHTESNKRPVGALSSAERFDSVCLLAVEDQSGLCASPLPRGVTVCDFIHFVEGL